MKIPRRIVRATAFGAAGVCALGVAAQAEEITIENDHQQTAATYWNVGDQENHFIGSYEQKGVSRFPDEDVASYEGSGWYDYTGGRGAYEGYGRYTFADGSTIVESYAGEGGVTSDGGRDAKGTNRFIAGTGRFSGVSGEGTHDCTRSAAMAEAEINFFHCEVQIDANMP